MASNKLGLSIEIPIAWEYEPVFVETLQGDRLDLRSHIENLMVQKGLDYNDRLTVEFVREALSKDFFRQLSRSATLYQTWEYNLNNKLEAPYDKDDIVKLLKRILLSKKWSNM